MWTNWASLNRSGRLKQGSVYKDQGIADSNFLLNFIAIL